MTHAEEAWWEPPFLARWFAGWWWSSRKEFATGGLASLVFETFAMNAWLESSVLEISQQKLYCNKCFHSC